SSLSDPFSLRGGYANRLRTLPRVERCAFGRRGCVVAELGLRRNAPGCWSYRFKSAISWPWTAEAHRWIESLVRASSTRMRRTKLIVWTLVAILQPHAAFWIAFLIVSFDDPLFSGD